MVVVGEVGVVMVAVPGLPERAVHVPVPDAAIVVVPLGREVTTMVRSAPAFGLAVTVTVAMPDVPPLAVHLKE